MNNEPVAWMSVYVDEEGDKCTMFSTYNDPLNTNQVPLYTHPAELTDDEIIEVHVKTPFIDGYLNKNLIEFAKAILRKASEK